MPKLLSGFSLTRSTRWVVIKISHFVGSMKGATLAEIMKVTVWQPHTVRGFVSILGSKEGEKIESSKSADGERTYKIIK